MSRRVSRSEHGHDRLEEIGGRNSSYDREKRESLCSRLESLETIPWMVLSSLSYGNEPISICTIHMKNDPRHTPSIKAVSELDDTFC